MSVLAEAGGLLAAAAAGAFVGHAREAAGRPGARAFYPAVALGAALLALAGGDAARGPLAAGAGLLGAGAILRFGIGASGLAEAAALWIAVLAGASASRAPLAALAGGALAALLFRYARPERLFVHAERIATVRLTATSAERAVRVLEEALGERHAFLKRLHVEKNELHKHAEAAALVEFAPGAGGGPEDLRRDLAAREGVLAVEIE